MTKTIAIDRSREIALGFLYWLTFLVALEPGNLLNASGTLALSDEALRIVGASVLGALSAPLVLTLIRRFPIEPEPHLARRLAIHCLSAIAIAFTLIAVSCVLAPLLHVGDTRPFLSALPSQLQANWLLLAFCILAFAGFAQAARVLTRADAPAVEATSPCEHVTHVPVKATGRTLAVSLGDVDWVETQGNYLALRTGGTTHLIRETLVAFEAKLDPAAFVRIHRRTLVALNRVRKVEPLGTGDALVHMHSGATLRMSRSFRQGLRRALETRETGL